MKKFQISISTPTGKLFEQEIVSLNTETLEGRIGILANHSQFVSSLKVSKFSIETGEEVIHGVIEGGIITVSQNTVTIISTDFILEKDIDVSFQRSEVTNVNHQLKNTPDLGKIEEQTLNDRLRYATLQIETKEGKY